MGTTLDALKGNPGVKLRTVVQIEGYHNLLCDGCTAAERAELLAAYNAPSSGSATDSAVSYGEAIGGLTVDYESIRQEYNPWNSSFQETSIRFLMDDGPEDTFGAFIHKTGAGDEYPVTEDLDATETTIDIDNGGDLSGTAGGTKLYLGPEVMTFASQTDNDVTVTERGIFAPFKANTETHQRFAHEHVVPTTGFDVSYKSKITTAPRKWVGRHVAVRLHKFDGDNADPWSESHLAFAGTITDIQDSASGRTVVACEDMRAKMNKAVLYRDQFRGLVKAGMWIHALWEFDLTHWTSGTRTTTYGGSETLKVVSSGATGNFQINAGFYTHERLVANLGVWMSKLVTYNKPTLWFSTRENKYELVNNILGANDDVTINGPLAGARPRRPA